MEINVGEYVRTIDGIKKINHSVMKGIGLIFIDGLPRQESDVLKSSFNLIDLIEVGDIVTVFSDLHDRDGNQTFNINNENHLKHLKNGFDNGYYHLINVLTKQQFESNAYRIEKER